MARRRGYVIAFEGPEEMVSRQLDNLPDSPSVLKIGSMSGSIREHGRHLARHRNPTNLDRFIWDVDCTLKSRFKKADEFLAAGNTEEVRVVFLNGGAVGAYRTCTDAIKKYVPSVGGDTTRAERYLAKVVRDGVVRLNMRWQTQNKFDDPLTRAMRAAEELDARTLSLQPGQAYQYPRDPATPVSSRIHDIEGTPALDDAMLAVPQPRSHFSSWETPSDSHSSGHVSMAHEVLFQQAHLVPISPSTTDSLSHNEGQYSDFPVGVDGISRPPRAICEARRQEALMLLEGEAEPDVSYEPVLSLREDLVVLLREEASPTTLDGLIAAYESGRLNIVGAHQHPAAFDDAFLELQAAKYPTAIALQNEVRAQLKTWFARHEPALEVPMFTPMLNRSTLSDATQAALAIIDERTDLILAVGYQEGVGIRSYQSVVGKLVKLGKPDGKTYSRAGKVEFRRLLTELMVAHTSQPLLQQTGNPFENDPSTAGAILPHIATSLTSAPKTRYLLLTFAERHLPTIFALRAIIGGRKLKVAVVLNRKQSALQSKTSRSSPPGIHQLSEAEPSPLAQNPPTETSFSEADWSMVARTDSLMASESLKLTAKVWRALREANAWYEPGAEDVVADEDNRIRITSTTESEFGAPRIARPVGLYKHPERYEQGRDELSRALVPVGPASPPDSIPASPDAAPLPELPLCTPQLPAKEPSYRHPPPPHPSGNDYTVPASPEPTIRSSASGSSGSTWKGLTQKLKRSASPSVGRTDSDGTTSRLVKKLSALFNHPPPASENAARGKPISNPRLESTSRAMEGLLHLSQVMAPSLPHSTFRKPPVTSWTDDDAPLNRSDDDDDREHDDDTDVEERRVLGRFGSKRRRRDDDDKARRMLGLA